MSSFKNILFPTDFSPHARSALKYAAAFARAGNGRVILFSVQTGKVPANLMTLPKHIFEDQDSKWLIDLRRARVGFDVAQAQAHQNFLQLRHIDAESANKSGELHAKGVVSATNAVLHPWRKRAAFRDLGRNREAAPGREPTT